MRSALCLLALLLCLHWPAVGQLPVSLQLILAVDASGSVDATRFELQKRGYAAAFRDARVQEAIGSTLTGSIAVAMLQWTGPSLQVVVVNWSLLDSPAAANRFADAIGDSRRALFSGGTSIAGAIDFAMTRFPESPFQGSRRVIDVSGDGPNNRGRPAAEACDAAIANGATIDGLPILSLEPNLDRYNRDNVIGGPGAFMIVAREYREFAQAVRAKLITEIADLTSLDRFALGHAGYR